MLSMEPFESRPATPGNENAARLKISVLRQNGPFSKLNTVKIRYYAVLLGDRNLKILHNNGHFFFSSDDIEKKLFHKFSVNSILS